MDGEAYLTNSIPIRKPISKPRKKPARSVIPPPLEKEIQASIVEYLLRLGWFTSVIKEHWTGKGMGQFSTPGIPDVVTIKDGRVLMLEVKRPPPYGVVSNEQREWHRKWLAHGGEVHVVRSIDDVKSCIDGGAI